VTDVIEGIIGPHEAATRRAILCFATTAVIPNYGHGDPYRLDMAGSDLSLLNSGRAPLLDGHIRQLEAVLGVVETAWIEGQQAWAIVRFARHARALDLWDMVQDRIITNVSMGFRHPENAEVPDSEGVRLITAWRPYEVSLCAVPGNWTAGVLYPPSPAAIGAVVDAVEDRKKRELAEAVRAAQRQEKRQWAEAISPVVATRLGTDPALTAQVLAEVVA
jgi:phenylpyruvate tautomerase PptA (4-oxalocrotonate tautomerase family)